MSTESATILFTDQVGSTELSQQLSAEVADEVRRGHFSILRQAVAEAGGTEVKNLGDGLMAVFGSASAALGCAVAMQQRVERDNREREHSVGLRVGLSAGEVSRENDDYFGDPVVEAARLCATCNSGQILVTDVVRAMAGRRSRHQCRSLGELTLKGLSEPVETVEVLWEPLGVVTNSEAGTVVPLPPRLARRPAVGVIGREAETQVMADAAKRVAGAEGREVVLISGEAGMGKTTLAAEAAKAAFDTGACVLLGYCGEDLATPYQLFAEAIRHYVTHADEAQLVAHIEEYGSELARLAPALASRIPDLPPSKATDADTERYLLFAAVVGLLATVSQNQPVVLVLDDLQWADNASLLLLRHLAAAEQAMRVLVLGTYRDSELSRSHPLTDTLATLHRQHGVTRIELGGLDDSGVVAFLEAAAGQKLDDAGVGLAHAVYRETDGNPFFVNEVLRHLAETGAIYQDGTGRWTSEESLDQMALPESVRVVIGARVGRLGQDAERVLSMAAVIGRDFDLDLLGRVTKTTQDELLDILDAATTASLVRELADTPGHYGFAHALIQHTLYEDLGLTRQARAHRLIGEALEELCGDRPGRRASELARHWVSATQPIDLTKAISYSRLAGDTALRALAPADALRHYAQALDLYPHATDPDPVLALDLAIGLGTAQRQAGDPAFRDTLIGASRRAADLDDTERLVAAALANNRGYFSSLGLIDTDRVEVLESALEALPGADGPTRARLLARLCNELAWGPLKRRLALASEAKAMARRVGDAATLIQVILDCHVARWIPSTVEDQLAECQEGLAVAKGLDDPVALFWAADYTAIEAPRSGEFELASNCLLAANELAQKLQQPVMLWTVTFVRAMHAMLHGDTALAEELTTSALEIGNASGQPDAFTFYGTQLMEIRLQQGQLGEFVPLIASVAELNPSIPSYRAVLAAAHLDAGDNVSARELVEAAEMDGFALPMDAAWLDGIVMYARPVIELHMSSAAKHLLELLAPYHQQVPNDSLMCHEPVAMFLGGLATVLGRHEEAEMYFAEAAELNARGQMTFAEAHTNLLWGRMLRIRSGAGDNDRARVLLEQARESAAARGYAMVERRAIAELSKHP